MSGTFPSDPSPETVDITSNKPTLVSVADSGKRQARNAGGHLWEISINLPVMFRSEFEPINAFVMAQDGSAGEFQYVPPNKATPLGVATGTPVTATSYAAGVDSIVATGLTVSITGIMKAGDLIKFSGHSKVYMMTEDADSNASGAAVYNFKPELIEDLASGESLTVSDVEFTVYVSDVHKYRTSAPNLNSYKVKLMESL